MQEHVLHWSSIQTQSEDSIVQLPLNCKSKFQTQAPIEAELPLVFNDS